MDADLSHSANGGVSLQDSDLGVTQTDSRAKWEAGAAEPAHCLSLSVCWLPFKGVRRVLLANLTERNPEKINGRVRQLFGCVSPAVYMMSGYNSSPQQGRSKSFNYINLSRRFSG